MGRLEKRYDQKTKESLIQYFSTMVEEAGGNLHSLPTKVARKLDPILSTGADERDLVFSGLEDTMMTAYAKIRAIAKEKVRLLFTLPLSPPLPSQTTTPHFSLLCAHIILFFFYNITESLVEDSSLCGCHR